MNIQEFLLARVAQDEAESDADSGTSFSYELGTNSQHQLSFEHRRAAIYRHHDRSMTIMSIGKYETITRCGICPNESTRPCTPLKMLAQPNHDHPDYEAAWDLKPSPAT